MDKKIITSDPSAGRAPLHALPATGDRFRLVRYFALTSLVGVLLVLALLVYFYRAFATEALEQHETRDNVAITRIFASTLWPKYAEYLKTAGKQNAEQMRNHPEVARLRADVLRQMQGLSVVKIKIYDLGGMTVFSTDAKQIGEDKSDDDGVRGALAGKVVSEIAFENAFDAFEKVINDRNLISSYMPIRQDDRQAPQAVFEVYSDVTDYVNELERTTWKIAGVVLASLALLYLFLYAIVRRADLNLKHQAHAVETAYEEALEHSAMHDRLTGLPNRESLYRQLVETIGGLRTTGGKCAVLYLGLDGFKEINDSLGHHMGDSVLIKVAALLRDEFSDGNAVAHMGGDEFVVTTLALEEAHEIDRLLQAVRRVQQAVAASTVATGRSTPPITACVGVALYPDDGQNVTELLQAADVALAHAKRNGRGTYQFHAVGMNDQALETLALERDLHNALKTGQFVLHYQPKLELSSGRIIGAEALIRWEHPTRGLVRPTEFIALAQERGQIVPIGNWVMREACRQVMAWRLAGIDFIPIAVNLSAEHFKLDTLLPGFTQMLRDFDLPGHCLELELTESAIMRDTATAIVAMRQLKRAGASLALDDFGTGYSSLSQLKALPLDNLKLDQSFIQGLPKDENDLAICKAVIAMGHALGLKVIAEGVETKEQLAVLMDLGCDAVQGYLFAQPMPADEFHAFVLRHAGSMPIHSRISKKPEANDLLRRYQT